MAGPTTAANSLARDTPGRYFGHLWDFANSMGVAQRAVNVANGMGDSAVVLYDAAGAPLLTAAAALADGTANPTVGRVGTHPLLYNGTNWDRARSAVSNADPGAVPAQSVHAVLARPTGPTFNRQYTADAVADASDGQHHGAQMPMLFNGTTWDRQRNNEQLTVLASQSRTANTASADQTNYNHRGVMVFLDITATPNNAETLTPTIQIKDPVSGKYFIALQSPVITASTLGATPTAATFVFVLCPGIDTAAFGGTANKMVSAPLPRRWRVNVFHSAGGAWTYSVGASMIP